MTPTPYRTRLQRAARPAKPAKYSTAFPMTAKRRQIVIDIPADFYDRVRAKTKQDGVSLRSVVLAYLERWSEQV